MNYVESATWSPPSGGHIDSPLAKPWHRVGRVAGAAFLASTCAAGSYLGEVGDELTESAGGFVAKSAVSREVSFIGEQLQAKAAQVIYRLAAEAYEDGRIALSRASRDCLHVWLGLNPDLGFPHLSVEDDGSLIGTWLGSEGARVVVRFIDVRSVHYSIRPKGVDALRIAGETTPQNFLLKHPEALTLIA